jgi:hypothetical protein
VQQQQQELPQYDGQGSSISCHWCGLPGLSAAEYWGHQPLYHIDHDNKAGVCQLCGRWVMLHVLTATCCGTACRGIRSKPDSEVAGCWVYSGCAACVWLDLQTC